MCFFIKGLPSTKHYSKIQFLLFSSPVLYVSNINLIIIHYYLFLTLFIISFLLFRDVIFKLLISLKALILHCVLTCQIFPSVHQFSL